MNWIIGIAAIIALTGVGVAAKRKNRPVRLWGMAALLFPPFLLLFELMPTRRGEEHAESHLVLEWFCCLVVMSYAALWLLILLIMSSRGDFDRLGAALAALK